MAAEKARLADAGSADAAHYRPQLDGLHAIAVYRVVAFHSGLNRFARGFIGVDIFFVLSGYLVPSSSCATFAVLTVALGSPASTRDAFDACSPLP